jgi:glutamate racemase
MIGVLARDVWGLQTLAYLVQLYPEYDYIFLADKKNYHTYEKNKSQAQQAAFKSIQRLFDQWAKLVIIGSNIIANHALNERKQQFPEKKVIAITVPWLEETIAQEYKKIGILTTQWNITWWTYNNLFLKAWGTPDTSMHFIVATEYLKRVESWNDDAKSYRNLVEKYIQQFPKDIECLIIWCAYFPLTIEDFKEVFNGPIIDIPAEWAKKLRDYLDNHPEIDYQLSKNKKISYYTTGDQESFQKAWSVIMKQPIQSIQLII